MKYWKVVVWLIVFMAHIFDDSFDVWNVWYWVMGVCLTVLCAADWLTILRERAAIKRLLAMPREEMLQVTEDAARAAWSQWVEQVDRRRQSNFAFRHIRKIFRRSR